MESTSSASAGSGGTKACRRGHWRPGEDEKLRQLVEEFGPRNWNSIAEKLKGRSGAVSGDSVSMMHCCSYRMITLCMLCLFLLSCFLRNGCCCFHLLQVRAADWGGLTSLTRGSTKGHSQNKRKRGWLWLNKFMETSGRWSHGSFPGGQTTRWRTIGMSSWLAVTEKDQSSWGRDPCNGSKSYPTSSFQASICCRKHTLILNVVLVFIGGVHSSMTSHLAVIVIYLAGVSWHARRMPSTRRQLLWIPVTAPPRVIAVMK